MKVKRVFAPDMRQAMRRVRDEIGADAVILSSHHVAGGIEVVVTREEEYSAAQAEIKRREQPAPALAGARPTDSRRSLSQEELAAELYQAKLRIAEAQRRATTPQGGEMLKVNRQMDDDLEADYHFIMQTLERRKNKRSPNQQFFRRKLDRAQQSLREEPPSIQESKPVQKNAPAQLLHQVSPQENDPNIALIQSMQDEIAQLRQLVEKQSMQAEPAVNPKSTKRSPTLTPETVQPEKTPIQQKLLSLGMNERLVMQATASLEKGLTLQQGWKNALARLAESLPVVGEDLLARGGMLAFVGSTGVGKTTTIGKLAARYVLEHGSSGLALVTTDCYRIAAHEQLKTFGRILDVPVHVVDEHNNLEAVLMTLRGKKLVLIDTSGVSVNTQEGVWQKQMLEAVSLRLKKVLILSSSSQKELLHTSWENYQDLDLSACILTKLDECGLLGESLSLVIEKRLPVAYISEGQKIPDDLTLAHRQDLIIRAVMTAKQNKTVSRAEQPPHYKVN